MKAAISNAATAIGKGLVAGLAGTVAMTVSSTLEAKVQGRGDSDTPARAVAAVLGVDDYRDDGAKARVNSLAHWGYGTGLGTLRGLLALAGMGHDTTDVAFHGAVLGAEQTMMTALDLAPPITQWGGSEIATDLTHHTVYSLATNGVYRWLSS